MFAAYDILCRNRRSNVASQAPSPNRQSKMRALDDRMEATLLSWTAPNQSASLDGMPSDGGNTPRTSRNEIAHDEPRSIPRADRDEPLSFLPTGPSASIAAEEGNTRVNSRNQFVRDEGTGTLRRRVPFPEMFPVNNEAEDGSDVDADADDDDDDDDGGEFPSLGK